MDAEIQANLGRVVLLAVGVGGAVEALKWTILRPPRDASESVRRLYRLLVRTFAQALAVLVGTILGAHGYWLTPSRGLQLALAFAAGALAIVAYDAARGAITRVADTLGDSIPRAILARWTGQVPSDAKKAPPSPNDPPLAGSE